MTRPRVHKVKPGTYWCSIRGVWKKDRRLQKDRRSNTTQLGAALMGPDLRALRERLRAALRDLDAIIGGGK